MTRDQIDIPCPACGNVYVTQAGALPEDGAISCPACGEGLHLATGGAGGSAESRTPKTNYPTVIRLEEWESTGPAMPPTKPPAPAARDVVCPECGHSFDASTGQDDGLVALVVEDTEFFAHLASDALSSHFETVVADSIEAAIGVLGERRVDLIVLDLALPDGDGKDLLLSASVGGAPVLVYTSQDEASLLGTEWDELKRLGVRDVIHKGLNAGEPLLQKALELVAGVTTET